jgi:hypothetical protein
MFTVGADGLFAPPDLLRDLYQIESLRHLPRDVLYVMVQYCKPFIHPLTTTIEFSQGSKEGRRLVHNSDFDHYHSRHLVWTSFSIPSPMFYGFSTCTMGDHVYFVGGSTISTTGGIMCRRYHPTTDTWIPMASMNAFRPYLTLVVFNNNNRLYALSRTESDMSYYEFYDPNEDKWTLGTSPPPPHAENSCLERIWAHNSHVYNDQLQVEFNDYRGGGRSQLVRCVFTFLPNGHLRLLKSSEHDSFFRLDMKNIIHGDQRIIVKYGTRDAFQLINLKTSEIFDMRLPDHKDANKYDCVVASACKVNSPLDHQQNSHLLQIMCLLNTSQLYLVQFTSSASSSNWTWSWTLLEPSHPRMLDMVLI